MEHINYVKYLESLKGVGIIVYDTQKNIALVLENEEKPWKKPGQRSIVFETVEKKDSSLEETVKRALKEELGVSLGEEKIWFSEQIIPFIVYESLNDKFYKAEIYVYDVKLSPKQVIETQKFKNKEIKAIRFFPLEKILSREMTLRPGTIEVLLGENEWCWIKDGDYWYNIEDKNKF